MLHCSYMLQLHWLHVANACWPVPSGYSPPDLCVGLSPDLCAVCGQRSAPVACLCAGHDFLLWSVSSIHLTSVCCICRRSCARSGWRRWRTWTRVCCTTTTPSSCTTSGSTAPRSASSAKSPDTSSRSVSTIAGRRSSYVAWIVKCCIRRTHLRLRTRTRSWVDTDSMKGSFDTPRCSLTVPGFCATIDTDWLRYILRRS